MNTHCINNAPSLVLAGERIGRGVLVALAGSLLAPLAMCDRFGPSQIVTTQADHAYSVCGADLDGDGDLDLVSASIYDDTVAWYENLDGMGTFGAQRIITDLADGASCVFAVDLDGDGDQDVLAALLYADEIAWYENTDGLGTFGPPRSISTATDYPLSVFAADLDGDGDFDVLSGSSHDAKVAWYENTDGLGSFGPQTVISPTKAASVIAKDLDGDGDLDVLSASANDNTVAWYENTDGLGSFGSQQIITTQADYAYSVNAADLDGDGDLDVLSASAGDDKVAWYENLDGLGGFGSEQIISTTGGGAWSVHAADLDGDGDQDVLSASQGDGKVAWYENTNGLGAFGAEQVITDLADNVRMALALDVDSDGDLDVASASYGDDTIAWYENAAAAAVSRSAGSNPQSLTPTDDPILGADFTVEVDLAGTTGHSLAQLFGFASALTFTLGGGQVLLIDPADPAGELTGMPIGVGPVATFPLPLPTDLALAGYRVSLQAVHLWGVWPYALSNALDLTLGY